MLLLYIHASHTLYAVLNLNKTTILVSVYYHSFPATMGIFYHEPWGIVKMKRHIFDQVFQCKTMVIKVMNIGMWEVGFNNSYWFLEHNYETV